MVVWLTSSPYARGSAFLSAWRCSTIDSPRDADAAGIRVVRESAPRGPAQIDVACSASGAAVDDGAVGQRQQSTQRRNSTEETYTSTTFPFPPTLTSVVGPVLVMRTRLPQTPAL